MDDEAETLDLEAIQKALSNLRLHSKDASQVSQSVGVLAEASRSSEATREQLADPKILGTLLDLIECSINDALDTVEIALRCIGNACIGNDIAKEIITKHGFSWASQCLPADPKGDHSNAYAATDVGIAMLTAKVLYNVCSDYEPGQQQCFTEHIHYGLVSLYAMHEQIDQQDLPLLNEVLFWICSHLVPNQGRLPPAVLEILLSLPESCGHRLAHEDYALLLETCLLFLREQNIKENAVAAKLVEPVWRMFEWNEMRIMSLTAADADMQILVPLSTGLIWTFSDLAAMPKFAEQYSLEDEWIQNTICRDIRTGEISQTPRLVDAACQILGNLVWSLVSQAADTNNDQLEHLAQPLLDILKTSQDVDLRHSAVGLLIQLTRTSSRIRQIVGADKDTADIVQHLCEHQLPQLKQDGVALLRALGIDSPDNQRNFAAQAHALSSTASDDARMIE